MKSIVLSTLVCLLALGAAGCGRAPRIRSLTQESVIVAFGDSLTSGEGASRKQSYPAVLAELTGYEVVNAGVPGETTADGLQRLPSVLQANKPQLVILCMGGNDMLQKQDEPAIAGNLKAMVEAIRSAGADVILLGVPRPSLRLRPPAFYRDIAREFRLPCDLETLPEILSTRSLKDDYVHPNAKGYRRLAEAVADLIRKSQAP